MVLSKLYNVTASLKANRSSHSNTRNQCPHKIWRSDRLFWDCWRM